MFLQAHFFLCTEFVQRYMFNLECTDTGDQSSRTRYDLPSDTCAMISIRSVSCDPEGDLVYTFQGLDDARCHGSVRMGDLDIRTFDATPALPVKMTVIFEVTGFFWTWKWKSGLRVSSALAGE